MDLLRLTVFFGQSSYYENSPFLLLVLSFSLFLFLRYYDFGALRAYETCLLASFHLNDCKFRYVGFQKIGWIYHYKHVLVLSLLRSRSDRSHKSSYHTVLTIYDFCVSFVAFAVSFFFVYLVKHLNLYILQRFILVYILRNYLFTVAFFNFKISFFLE